MDETTRPTRSGARRPVVRGVTLLLIGVAGSSAALALAWWAVDQVASTRLWRVESFVAPVVVAAGAAAAAWLGVSALVAVACALARAAGGSWRTGEQAVHRWAPGLVRRSLAVAVAAGVGLGAATGAHATGSLAEPTGAVATTVDVGWAPTTTHDPARTTSAPADPPRSGAARSAAARPVTADVVPAVDPPRSDDASLVDGSAGVGAEVGAATGAAAPDAPGAERSTPAAPEPGGHRVVVSDGDTLWAIAARELGPDATDARIAAEWPRWYRANAATIGPDPDVVRPGQVLVAPPTPESGTR